MPAGSNCLASRDKISRLASKFEPALFGDPRWSPWLLVSAIRQLQGLVRLAVLLFVLLRLGRCLLELSSCRRLWESEAAAECMCKSNHVSPRGTKKGTVIAIALSSIWRRYALLPRPPRF